jgi:uncharacterized protein
MTFEYWYIFPIAVLIAIFANASGFSGAVLFQPIFYFFLNVPIVNSIATGIATETLGMSSGAYRYYKMGYVDQKAFRRFLPWTLVGVLLGLFLFVKFSDALLKLMVGTVMVLIALGQLFSLYVSHKRKIMQANNKWASVGLVAGAFSASTGTGVAEMSQPTLEHKMQIPTKKANATAILLEASADWLITLFNLSLGNINWNILIFSASGVIIGGQIGAHLSPHLSDKLLKTVFAVAVFLIGVFYVYRFVSFT